MSTVPGHPAEVAYEQARLDALSQSTARLRLARRRLARQQGPVPRARRQAIDHELHKRGHE